MKILITAVIALVASFSCFSSYTFEVTELCDDKPHLKKEITSKKPLYLSELTLDILKQNKIPFTGNEYGIKTMLGSPSSEMFANMEVISDTKLRSYGWCVEIDGNLPDTTMDQVYLKPKHIEHVRWFLGYADYDSGKWLNYCIPVYKNKKPYICNEEWRDLL